MSCTAILCLSGLFVEGAAGYVLPPMRTDRPEPFHHDRRYDMNRTSNPMGSFSLGHEWNSTKWRVTVELRHESWLGTRQDKGLNGAWTSIRYRPFAR
jgi:hypothetical protein